MFVPFTQSIWNKSDCLENLYCKTSFLWKWQWHTGSNPCINQFVHLFPNYLTTNCPNITHIEKIQKNPENIQSRSKIREISSQGQKSGSGIPEKFLYKNFIKSHFRGGLCYKFFLKNDCNPQKSRFFALFMYSTFLHRTEGLM